KDIASERAGTPWIRPLQCQLL
ncbi:unnamed protein product, partial [Allacma fusca]